MMTVYDDGMRQPPVAGGEPANWMIDTPAATRTSWQLTCPCDCVKMLTGSEVQSVTVVPMKAI